jgi:phosphatidate phosphatase PAH1
MLGPNLAGFRGTKITDFISYTLISIPRDSTRIVDLGGISNLYIFDLINLRLLLFPIFI